MRVARIYSDGKGESHFDDVDIGFSETGFIAGARPIGLSEPWPAERVTMARVPSGWSDARHPTPVRQLAVFLSGGAEMTAGDGDTRSFGKGDVVLLEDVGGAGHGARFTGDEESLVLLITLA